MDNDRFFANYNMLKDNYDELSLDIVKELNKKCVSANWKYVKKNLKFPYLRSDFTVYLDTKLRSPKPNFTLLQKYAQRFSKLDGILRTADMKEAIAKGDI